MIFFGLILIIGVITTFTDLKNKKIYNQHLVIGAIVSLIATAYVSIFQHEHVLFHFINGSIAFLIGFILHRSSLWKGGDAKLFTLYAFIMPVPVYSHILFPSVVDLFANSFIAGTIILLPLFIKDILLNHKVILNDLFSPAKREACSMGIIRIIFLSWALFPFYYLARITNPVIILTISFLMFNWGYETKKEVKKHYIIETLKNAFIKLSALFVFGLLTRLWLCPNALSYTAFLRFLIVITLSAATSIFIHTTLDHFKYSQERVPFAPLLFIGCLLSYTPFLTKITHLAVRWNLLSFR
jgi:Flp pilus assembly protein protease CpaA